MEILGVSGPPASGKDTAAEYLELEYGYKHISTSDLLREEAIRRGLSTERSSLQDLGAELRSTYHKDPLLKQALSEVNSNTVFTGLRTAAAAKSILATSETSAIIYLDSPQQERFERINFRSRGEEALGTFATFKALDEREIGLENNDMDFSLHRIRSLARFVISNTGDIPDLYTELDKVVSSIKRSNK